VRVHLTVVALVAVVAASGLAHAEQQPARVVVATSDRILLAALADALFPAGMIVMQVDDAAPAAIGELTATSRTVAEREGAAAVVWLLLETEGMTLVAYDRAVDRVLVRPLPYIPPLSPARAAETARAARTMLRALKRADDSEPERPAIVEVPITIATPPPPRPWPNIAAFVGFGGRYGRLGEDGVVEAQIAAAWRPDALGVIAMASLSPQASLSSPAFMGHVSDNSFAVAARVPFEIAPRIAVAGMAGPALHAVRVAGTLGAEAVTALRFDAAFRVAATGGYAVTDRLDVGLSISMDTLLKRQRYEVTGGQVLVMPRLQVSVGLLISIRVL
jgi:hypothetical protein